MMLKLTGQQAKGKAISLTPLYHSHPLHRHLDASRTISAGSLHLHMVSFRTPTGKLWFPEQATNHLALCPND